MSEEEELRRWREGLDRALTKPRRGRRLLRGLATSMILIGVVGAAGIAYFYQDIERMLSRVNVDLNAPTGDAMNILVIGSDSREGLSGEDVVKFGRSGGRRADTIILAQVVPKDERATLLHFPRDLWVEVAGRGKAKINSAYQYGPQTVIDTVQGLTGVAVNHYMEVDINGFRRMVDAIGGIDVCLEERLNDRLLRFRLPAGHSHLDGESALSFVRSRHSTADGDFGRIRRQQQFLRAVVAKVGRPSVLGNPVRVKNLGEAFAQNVTVDPGFNLNDMLSLAIDVRRVGVDQIATLSVPGRITSAAGQSIVAMDVAPAQRLFQALRDVQDPAKAFAPHIAVEDASGRGLLEQVSRELEGRGFVIERMETLPHTQQRTVVTYPRDLSEEGQRVADVLPGARRLNGGAQIVVTIGATFEGLAAPAPVGAPVAGPAGPCAA